MDDQGRMIFGLDSLDKFTARLDWRARIVYHAIYALTFALRDIANAIREHAGGS